MLDFINALLESSLAVPLVSSIVSIILFFILGMRYEKVYSVVTFFALHTPGVSVMAYDLVKKGKTNKLLRFFALFLSSLPLAAVPVFTITYFVNVLVFS